MNRSILLPIAVAVTMMASASCFAQVVSSNNDDGVVKVDQRMSQHAYRAGEVIVKFKSQGKVNIRKVGGRFRTSSVSAVDKVMNQLGVTDVEQMMPLTGAVKAGGPRKARSYNGGVVEEADLSKLYCMKFDTKKVATVEKAVAMLKEMDEVEYAEPNYLVFALGSDADTYKDEPMYGNQQWYLDAIGLPRLWARPKLANAKRPVIAILDTGVDIDHPDLKGNIWTNEKEAAGTDGVDNDGNGFAGDVHGWDFVNQTARIGDWNGHGTHCAGIAAATGNNGIGITGANPDALIMPVTVMQSDGVGDVATICRGIDYAVANGADFVSMSFGGYTYSIAEEQALAKAYQKATLVAAAGNDFKCINQHFCPVNGSFVNGPCYPAAFTFVLGVQATAQGGGLAGFSNYDCDGPIYSAFGEEKLYNYELGAPGAGIYSTYPGGKYKAMNGTSMAAPLAAGVISRLMECKDYNAQVTNREMLFGDLIHSLDGRNINVWKAYKITDADREPTLWFVGYDLVDSVGGDGDGRPDAGETIEIYPTLRNDWGAAHNIKLTVELAENEDPSIAELLTPAVDFGRNLDSYGKGRSTNPLKIKINKDCVDGRHIRLVLKATCDNSAEECYEQPITLDLENGVEIGGMIEKNTTLYPNVHYIVTKSIAIPAGVTLTIKPGTVLRFKDNTGITCADSELGYSYDDTSIKWHEKTVGGHIKAFGTPDSMIYFTSAGSQNSHISFHYNALDTIEYSVFVNLSLNRFSGSSDYNRIWEVSPNCILSNIIMNDVGMPYSDAFKGSSVNNANFYENEFHYMWYPDFLNINVASNLVEIASFGLYDHVFKGVNIYNNKERDYKTLCNISLGQEALLYKMDNPSYFGSGREDIARKGIWDIEHGYGTSKIDLSNMRTRPNPECHGVVWKVVVDGHDAQDEFDSIPPLGVGKHKFEVYFSRPDMDTTVTPTVAMGVRPPYTQIPIAENGSWSIKDSVSVYTCYLDITGRLRADGLNRIYVDNARDGEHFEVPVENMRYNVQVDVAGAMSADFQAKAGLGKVSLEWATPSETEIADMMGYNMYRYEMVNDSTPGDTIRLNLRMIDASDTTFVDYDVVPGKTYCYYYKVMSTDLSEGEPSKTVASTPLSSKKGDSNGDMSVDVADVVTDISYMTFGNPQPFIFEAADVNSDSAVDILDVVGTVRIITHPAGEAAAVAVNSCATYSVKDGVLSVDCPAAIGGVQATIDGVERTATIKPLEALEGMEIVDQPMDGDRRMVLAYSMSGKTIAPGHHDLLQIGSGKVTDIVISDPTGKKIMAVNGNATGIGAVEAAQIKMPYPNPFVEQLTVPYVIGRDDVSSVKLVLTDLAGSTVAETSGEAGFGEHKCCWNLGGVARGVYFVSLYADGKLMQTTRVVKR